MPHFRAVPEKASTAPVTMIVVWDANPLLELLCCARNHRPCMPNVRESRTPHSISLDGRFLNPKPEAILFALVLSETADAHACRLYFNTKHVH